MLRESERRPGRDGGAVRCHRGENTGASSGGRDRRTRHNRRVTRAGFSVPPALLWLLTRAYEVRPRGWSAADVVERVIFGLHHLRQTERAEENGGGEAETAKEGQALPKSNSLITLEQRREEIDVYQSPKTKRWRVWVGDRYLPSDYATAAEARAAGLAWIDELMRLRIDGPAPR